MRIYIVEDSRERIEWFRKVFFDCEIYHTKDIEQACKDIEENEYDIIFLDRDLSHYELNGENIALYMKDKKLAQKSAIIIHSVNPNGQTNIKKILEEYHPYVLILLFTQLKNMKRVDFKFKV
jgi:DNA-binding LytR/AlgR family response regulator